MKGPELEEEERRGEGTTSTRVTTWRAAAAVLGISEDTLLRHRQRFGDNKLMPWWRDEEDVIAWYQAMTAPPKPEPAPRKPKRQHRFTEPLDVRAKLRELTGG